MRKDDAAREREFLEHLSEENRYLRFMKWVKVPNERLVSFLTDIDYERHMAFACVVPGEKGEPLVGQARYVVNPDGKSCEFSIVIADAWHKSGVAGLLMQALLDAARARGLATMEGIVLRANREMIRFVRALGFEVWPSPEDPTLVRVTKAL